MKKMSIANHKVPTRSWLNSHLSSGDFPCTSNEPHPVMTMQIGEDPYLTCMGSKFLVFPQYFYLLNISA